MNYEFLPNMKVYSRLELYSNYLKDPQNIDVRWEVQLNMPLINGFRRLYQQTCYMIMM